MSSTFTDPSSTSFGEENREFAGFEDQQYYDMPELQPLRDVVDYAKEYAREKPEMAALWCFGIGFVLGWKLKPW